MKYLFADTETDRLWVSGAAETDPRQPRPIQVAFATYDERGREITAASAIVAPLPGWPDVTTESAGIHGISREHRARGIAPDKVRELLLAVGASKGCVLVGHTLGFDIRVLRRMFLELGQKAAADYFLELPAYDTMVSSVEVCRLPKVNGGSGYKRPTLTEAHRHLAGSDFSGAHDALADVRACATVFFALRALGVTPQPPVLPPTEGERDQAEVRAVLGQAVLVAKSGSKEGDFVQQMVDKLKKDGHLSPTDPQWRWLQNIVERSQFKAPT
jgi:DNA polymerase III epsilon subunit-like protein